MNVCSIESQMCTSPNLCSCFHAMGAGSEDHVRGSIDTTQVGKYDIVSAMDMQGSECCCREIENQLFRVI